MAVVAATGGVGLAAATGVGGLVVQHWGWRAAFLVGAVPGLMLTVLIPWVIRGGKTHHASSERKGPPLRAALAQLWARRAFVYVCVGIAIGDIGVQSCQAWIPAYLMRRFAQNEVGVAQSYSLVSGIAMIVGMMAGGFIADRLAARYQRVGLWLQIVGFGLQLPLLGLFLAMPSMTSASLAALPLGMISYLWVSPSYTMIQRLSGQKLRATGAAVFLMIVNLIGLGLGPWLTGWLSDLFSLNAGEGLRNALLAACLTCPVAAVVLMRGLPSLVSDVRAADGAGLTR